MGGGSVVAPAACAAVGQNFPTSVGAAEDDDPVVREELVLLDFPEFSFAPSLKKRKYLTLPEPAGAAVRAAADLVAERVEASAASLTPPRREPAVSGETPTTPALVDQAMSKSGDATPALAAAQAAFLARADLKVRAWDLGTPTPSLLLGDFSFKGERRSQRVSNTALFRIERQQSGEQDKAAASGDGAQVRLQGIAQQVMTFAVDTTAAAAKASCDVAASANHA
ncbi:hypothetical protein ACSSS7_005762 [Eimeria intestinalis]